MKSFYEIEDRPPLGTSLVLALQHMLAAFGAIIAVPLVVGGVLGLPESTMVSIVSAALLVSGIITIVQCLGLGLVGIRMPCVMGTSFTFVAVLLNQLFKQDSPEPQEMEETEQVKAESVNN